MTELARRAYLWACALDVVVRKPGNVSVESPGHGMIAEQFVASAIASVDALFERDASVGQRIEGAIKATRAAVECNTNLGIVLLCAPLAAALEAAASTSLESLRAQVHITLARMDVDDARAAYRAIALANPGGLGAAAQQDVRNVPSIDLRAAMQLAADRDRVARQYAEDFAEIFDLGLPHFTALAAEPATAMLACCLTFLASGADSHIVRKHGGALAHSVTEEAVAWLQRWRAAQGVPSADALAAWDERLKGAGLNPGTSADLAVASAFVAAVIDPRLSDVRVPGLAWNVLNSRPTLTRLSG
ncbi:MAG TPA: triphosphoribosyl-dephospho-CoA synthase [Burkholderiaceae bacterium]|nr:triphosphoribosyl-dephospho-CoA synthase [Burkholderiaceae bacterium]